MPISFARFVLAGACSSTLTPAVPRSACSAMGSGDEGACSSLTPSVPLRVAVGSAAPVAPARLVRAATECDRARRLPRCGSCSPLGAGPFVTPVSTFASAFVFARLLVCLAMASLSKSAPRLSRCLHHLKPGARWPGGAATSRSQCPRTAMLVLVAKSSGIERTNAFFGGTVGQSRTALCVADHRLSSRVLISGSNAGTLRRCCFEPACAKLDGNEPDWRSKAGAGRNDLRAFDAAILGG